MMNTLLAQVFSALKITSVTVNGIKKNPRDHAIALMTYLHLGNYFSTTLLEKAVNYLAAAKPFAVSNAIVLSDLQSACRKATQNYLFDAEIFFDEFAKEDYFSVSDVVDILTFLQQTAFDRQFGVERDVLSFKPWIKDNLVEFYALAKRLDVIDSHAPSHPHYHAICIMGASSSRVLSRLAYFQKTTVNYDMVVALSGNRELSKGLDDEVTMQNVANFMNKPVNYVEKRVGNTTRIFLDGVTETMLVNYMIHHDNAKRIRVIDSVVQDNHWRATTAQSAKDIAKLLLTKIHAQEIKNSTDTPYHVFIIAEQPYSARMAKQVQREFDKEIAERAMDVVIEVEGCGQGIESTEATQEVMTRVDSELGALMAERFYDARAAHPDWVQRDPAIIMFASREATFKELSALDEHHQPATLLVR